MIEINNVSYLLAPRCHRRRSEQSKSTERRRCSSCSCCSPLWMCRRNHFIHSVRSGSASSRARAHLFPPVLTEWSFTDTEGDRAELVLQTDVRVNSSGERFLSRAHSPSQPPLRSAVMHEYEPGASKWPNPATTLWYSNISQAKPQNVCVCVWCLYLCEVHGEF